MTVRLVELKRALDSEHHPCVIEHGAGCIAALIVGEFDCVRELQGKFFSAEYSLESIAVVEANLPKNNELSGLFGREPGVLVDGSIHQIHDLDDDSQLFDIYIMNGPEFLLVTTEQLNGASPELNSRIRVSADQLIVFPTFP